MKTQTVNTKSNRWVKALLFCAAALPFSMATSGHAQAEVCQPLQVSNITPTHARWDKDSRSFSFLLNGYVQNRNPGIYLGRSGAWLSLRFKNNAGRTGSMQNVTFGTHIPARNGKVRFVGNNKYTFNYEIMALCPLTILYF